MPSCATSTATPRGVKRSVVGHATGALPGHDSWSAVRPASSSIRSALCSSGISVARSVAALAALASGTGVIAAWATPVWGSISATPTAIAVELLKIRRMLSSG